MRWGVPTLVTLAWLVLASVAGPFAGKLGDVQTNDSGTFLPVSAESTQVVDLEARFAETTTVPAVVVAEREGGVTEADARALAAAGKEIGRLDGVVGEVAGPVPSDDGEALELVVPLDDALGDRLPDVVDKIRTTLDASLPDGLERAVTGPAGFTADLGTAFAGIDGLLLLVAVAVVLVILVIVYRSPLLPVLVLLSAVFALAAASAVVYVLADHGVLTLSGQSQGILFILVVGAATDYALLLTARYREELRTHESPLDAMRTAWRRAVTPVLASGGTVVVSLLCLLVSDLSSTRSLGPVAAIGIVCALVSALTFLPGVLLLVGRAAFWPARPRFGSDAPEGAGLWGRVAHLVGARPRSLWIGCTVGLLVLAAFLPTLRASGTSQSDVFLRATESTTGQEIAAEHFPGGAGSPTVIIGPADEAAAVVEAAQSVPGVSSVAVVGTDGRPTTDLSEATVVDGLVQVDATLEAPADSEQAVDVVRAVRAAVHDAAPSALVGGATAQQLDSQTTAVRDRNVVIPLVLLVVLVLLGLLLRAVVAPVVLLASVVLSFAATLGASALVFDHLFDFPGADPSVPLFGFVFLVALGVDYNIFLMTRVREESARHGTRDGVLRGLVATGGVITSAGVVLAATFAALVVIPLLFLAQLAFIVAFGVLLDTLVVRTLLVPAATLDLDDRVWWPSRLSRRWHERSGAPL